MSGLPLIVGRDFFGMGVSWSYKRAEGTLPGKVPLTEGADQGSSNVFASKHGNIV